MNGKGIFHILFWYEALLNVLLWIIDNPGRTWHFGDCTTGLPAGFLISRVRRMRAATFIP